MSNEEKHRLANKEVEETREQVVKHLEIAVVNLELARKECGGMGWNLIDDEIDGIKYKLVKVIKEKIVPMLNKAK